MVFSFSGCAIDQTSELVVEGLDAENHNLKQNIYHLDRYFVMDKHMTTGKIFNV